MIGKSTNNQIPIWWHREINSSISLIVLIISTIAIFGIGALFVREYISIWTEIGQRQQSTIYFPEKPGLLEKIILP